MTSFQSNQAAATAVLRGRAVRRVTRTTRDAYGRSQRRVPIGNRQYRDRYGWDHPRHLQRSGWWAVWSGGVQVAGMTVDLNGVPVVVPATGTAQQVVGRAGYNARYAAVVHNGTRLRGARPFLTENWRSMSERILRETDEGGVGIIGERRDR